MGEDVSVMMNARHWGKLSVVLACLLLGGCQAIRVATGQAGSSDTDAKGGPAPQISGVALPDGYSLDTNRTIILGEGDRWIGRLSYSVNSSSDTMFEFIRREMINQGWAEVAVVRAETSQLTYLSGGGDRVASILIARSTVYGSKIDMTVSPAAGAGVAPARGPSAQRR